MAEQEYDIEEEISLIKKIGTGDKASLSQLYDRYSGVLYALIYKIVNNEEEAQDVLQDVFIQIWAKAYLYKSERGKPLTWAMTMSRNKAIDRLRSSQRRHRLKEEATKDTSYESLPHQPDASEMTYLHEKSAVIREAVTKLSKEQREAIELAFFKGMTQLEIAEQLGEPLGTIKARIRRGMMKLRDLVQPKL